MGRRLLSWPGRVVLALLVVLAPASIGAVVTSANAVPPPPQNWNVLVGSQTSSMGIQGQRFLPGDVTIDAGDSVTWKANSAEIHTVTFINGGTPQTSLPPLNPADPTELTRQGPDTMTPATDFNSGLLTTLPDAGPLAPYPVYTSYTLKFPVAGTYTYYCRVHGVMMRGVVHVQDSGAPYPYTQADYDAQAAFLAHAINQDGYALWSKVKAAATAHKVFTGADDGTAMLMRFVRGKIVVHKGDRVRFVNTMSMGAPHTVSFGKVPTGPAIFQPSGDPTNYRGGTLTSGLLTPGAKFIVTFKKVGTFSYVCALHDDMGMKGVVVVKP